ncbi:cytochrome P450 [Amycolatopsis sp. cmx-4-68]|uniref:cytochrome P450 n=1 Tax=Amycolatopsis sp. cmx-4-68 TaxID=2790938 RepID=UPI00397E312D
MPALVDASPAAADLSAVELAAVDLADPAFHAGDPHLVWAAMRARSPLHRQDLPDGRAFWSVTRYADVGRVLSGHDEFTSTRGSLLTQLGGRETAAGVMLVASDPPAHTRLRRPLASWFNAAAAGRLEERITAVVRRILRGAAEGGPWDVARETAVLPVAVAAALMRLPEEDWPELARWTGMAAAPEDPAYRVARPEVTLAVAHHSLFEYFAGLARTTRGTDDLIGHLVAGAGGLSRDEVVVNCYSILLGATATTPHTISGTVCALAERPGLYRAVVADPGRVPGLVEEGLRWTSAASSFLRHATGRVELAGGTVEAGEAVVAWVGSANRDDAVFTDPFRFDLGRRPNRHLAFGLGPHYCLGASLARLTLQVFFTEFTRLVSAVEPAGVPVHLRSNFVRGLTSAPVRVTPA